MVLRYFKIGSMLNYIYPALNFIFVKSLSLSNSWRVLAVLILYLGTIGLHDEKMYLDILDLACPCLDCLLESIIPKVSHFFYCY